MEDSEECQNVKYEDLLKLRDKIGTKAFNKKVLGILPEQKKAKNESSNSFRHKKNRPQEMSSKKPVSKFRKIVPIKRKKALDPRFDNLYGNFDEQSFKKNYEFLGDIRKNELNMLKEAFRNESDPEEREKIKFLITRMENQMREKEKLNARKEKERSEQLKNIELLKKGKHPHFQSKREKKMTALIDQFEQLKKDGKLPKYLEKKRKKEISKHRKHLPLNDE